MFENRVRVHIDRHKKTADAAWGEDKASTIGRRRAAHRSHSALLVPRRGAAERAERAGRSRLTGFRLTGNEPIEIESDRLEVQETENKAIFTGNVNVTQGPTVLKPAR